MIHAYASRAHYAAHVRPIFDALPDEIRGEFWTPRRANTWGTLLPNPRQRPEGPVLVASFVDARKLTGSARLIYVEHGAGQTYDGDPRGVGHGSYAGGKGLDAVDLFICPRQEIANRWVDEYGTPAAAVGCPRLDAWHSGQRSMDHAPSTSTTVAITFHWENPLVPESRSALPHYRRSLEALVSAVRLSGGKVLGHGHPRAWSALWRLWRSLDVEAVENLDDVFARAGMLVADNTSAMYEFASLDRPVVALNAPWYRRDVAHGLRFWDAIPGIQVDDPADLVAGVALAAKDPPHLSAVRRDAVARTYASTDGHASERAVAAIMEVFR